MVILSPTPPVSWTRDGARYTARVEPRATQGPTVVRVLVSDEFGNMIDMPFLTIHLRSRQGQFSVSASDACARLAFARGAAVMLASP